MVHEFDPNMRDDSEFVDGVLQHVVVGNRGRLLDPRRTPVSIAGVDLTRGTFSVRIEAFEDEGAVWVLPLEHVDRFQFEKDADTADAATVNKYRERVEQLDRPLIVDADPSARTQTEARIEKLGDQATEWIRTSSAFIAGGAQLDFESRTGPDELAQDLQRFFEERSLLEIEDAFAQRWVSNPSSGELVKGHRIVCAELGLAPFEGKIVRDPHLFDDPWSKEARADHILWRLAFVRAVLRELGFDTVTLYRGMSSDRPPDPPRNYTFVSASFSFEVARSLFGRPDTNPIGVLYRQAVPVERLFMTYLETAAMNQQYLEAEAVLLWDAANPLF